MRADKFFAETFGSRTKAKEALEAGRILRNGKPLSPSDCVERSENFTILQDDDFVSNGGRKLERGLRVFGENVEGETAVDLGASTGGFTDCLLRRGAKRVYCVDVGENQLARSLAADARVVIMDRTNARNLTHSDFPEPIRLVVSDLSFISLRLVLPAVSDILREGGRAFLLFKPQFECDGVGLGKNGILPKARHAALLSDFYDRAESYALMPRGIVNAPVFPQKNIEYVVFLEKNGVALAKERFLALADRIL